MSEEEESVVASSDLVKTQTLIYSVLFPDEEVARNFEHLRTFITNQATTGNLDVLSLMLIQQYGEIVHLARKEFGSEKIAQRYEVKGLIRTQTSKSKNGCMLDNLFSQTKRSIHRHEYVGPKEPRKGFWEKLGFGGGEEEEEEE